MNVADGVVIRGTTEFVGVIGDPVSHSISPRLHNRAYRELGADLCYGAFRVPVGGVAAAIGGARALGFRGLSVTTPHKQDAARFSDQRTEEVAALGVANTIVFLGGVATAMVTDGQGLLADLRVNCGYSVAGQPCAVIGAGGAARAVVFALARAGAREILVVNRTQARAEEAAVLGGDRARVARSDELGDATLVVNATSISLGASGPPTGEDARFLGAVTAPLRAGQLAVDLTYHPPRSAFLELANQQGATVRNGLGMLVHQAALQVEAFAGVEAPLAAMWDEVGAAPNG